jgi:hypothetical protein
MTDLRQLADDLDQLREDVDYLTTLLEPDLDDATGTPPTRTVAGPGAPKAGSSKAYVWHTLTTGEAGGAWDTLTGWVDWLIDRYVLEDTIPACWYRHGAMTDELDALRAAWTAAYLDPNPRPIDAAFWHDLLDRTLTRLRTWDRYGCSAGTHHDDTSTSNAASRQARDDHLHADIAARARHLLSVPTDNPATG